MSGAVSKASCTSAFQPFSLRKGNQTMSEHEKPKKSFMQELDDWSLQAVITPVLDDGPDAIAGVKQAIRQKVLDSYHNGQKAKKSYSR